MNWDDFNRSTDLHPLANPMRLIDLIAMSRATVNWGAK